MASQVPYLDDAAAKPRGSEANQNAQAQPKITFYLDIISPFGYLAYYMLRNSPVFRDVQIRYVPLLLGGLHKQCGNVAPIQITNKKDWINRERERWAEYFQIPIRDGTPPGFPFSTVNVMRALTALSGEVEGEVLARAIDAVWAVVWNPRAVVLRDVRGRGEDGEFDIKNPETLKALLASVDGISEELAARSVGRTGEKDVKDQLLANTNGAFEVGAFGIPWFQCENSKGETEGFWGFDHLGQVVRFLGLEESGDLERSGKRFRALL